jgi:hypothetical protein
MNIGFYMLFLVPAVLLALWAIAVMLRHKPNDDMPENSRADSTEPPGLTGSDQHRHRPPAT